MYLKIQCEIHYSSFSQEKFGGFERHFFSVLKLLLKVSLSGYFKHNSWRLYIWDAAGHPVTATGFAVMLPGAYLL